MNSSFHIPFDRGILISRTGKVIRESSSAGCPSVFNLRRQICGPDASQPRAGGRICRVEPEMHMMNRILNCMQVYEYAQSRGRRGCGQTVERDICVSWSLLLAEEPLFPRAIIPRGGKNRYAHQSKLLEARISCVLALQVILAFATSPRD